jgi:hypothetical protein
MSDGVARVILGVMKLSLLTASVAALVATLSPRAHAADSAIRSYFASTASHDVVQTAACSFDAASTFDGRDHVFDVRVAGERCPHRAIDASAIPLFIHLESGDEQRVVVETSAPDGVDADKLRAAVMDITSEIRRRIAFHDQPRVVYSPVPMASSQAAAWTSGDDWRPRRQRANPGLMAGGIVLIAGGSIATFGGAVSMLSNYPFGDATPGMAALAMGVVGVAVGIPMLVIGAKKVPAVTASVSPTGGNLRVTF